MHMSESDDERFRRLLGQVISDTTRLEGIRLLREQRSSSPHAVTIIALSATPLESYSLYEFEMVPRGAPFNEHTLMVCFQERVRPALEALGCVVLPGPPYFQTYDLIDYPVIKK